MKKAPIKKTELSKTQEYAIQGMLAEGKTVSEIAQFLKKARAIVEAYIKDNAPKPEPPALPKELRAGDFIINKSANQKSGVAIMTAGASEKGDESRKSVTGQATTSKTRNVIYKINKDR